MNLILPCGTRDEAPSSLANFLRRLNGFLLEATKQFEKEQKWRQ